MFEKIRTLLWFAARPSFWPQAIALIGRKFQPDLDTAEDRQKATAWAAQRAVPLAEALSRVGLSGDAPDLDPALIAEGQARAAKSQIEMGGPGDINLLFAAVQMSGAQKVVETGVAYGWSSLAILAGLQGRENAKLVSVDMPYPKMGNEAFVGIAVPDRLRGPWELVRQPDRNGLRVALSKIGGSIDLCHYDSDKSTYGRRFGFPLLWNALRPGGIFISDDIQDNMGFADFAEETGMTCRDRVRWKIRGHRGEGLTLDASKNLLLFGCFARHGCYCSCRFSCTSDHWAAGCSRRLSGC